MALRFRGYLPVVIDVETAGFNCKTDALLEIAAVTLQLDETGRLRQHESHAYHVEPFPGAKLNPEALAFNGIDPYHPFRLARPEADALGLVFQAIRHAVKEQGCTRAILVGHNAAFDLGFIKALVDRTGYKHSPFHAFSVFDTVSLAGLSFGQTVLAKAAQLAGLGWDNREAHSAIYDAEQTARLFCSIVNRWQTLDPIRVWEAREEGELGS